MSKQTRAVALVLAVVTASLAALLASGALGPSRAAHGPVALGSSLTVEGPAPAPLGRHVVATDGTTLTMVVVPSEDPFAVARAAEQVADLIEQTTGHTIYAYLAGCYGAAVDALASGDGDIGWLPASAYVVAHDRFGVQVRLVTERFGATSYRGQFLTRQDSGIDELADLQGLNFAFSDRLSASSYMYPAVHISRTQGMTYGAFFNDTVFAGSHNAVVAAVYDGDFEGTPIHGGATYEDARGAVKDQYPDVFTVTQVIATTDSIPNDTFSMRAGLDAAVADEIVSALLEIADTAAGEEALQALYSIDGLQPAADADYDVVREVVDAFGLAVETCGERGVLTPGSGLDLVHDPGEGLAATIEIPSEAVSQEAQVAAQPIPAITHRPDQLEESGLAFNVRAVISGTTERLSVLEAPYTVTVTYDDGALGAMREDSLALYLWDGSAWIVAADNAVDEGANTVTATSTRPTHWALLGESNLTIVVVPSAEPEATARAAEHLAELLAGEVGAPVYAFVAGCYGGAVEALGRGEADVGFLPATAYVVAHDRYGVDVRLVQERFGSTTYRGQFIVRDDSGYDDLADLAGANFAAPDPLSSSGFLYPALHISHTQGMTYGAFFDQTVFVGSHDEVVRAVYSGEFEGTPIQVGATYDDARQALTGELPDVLTETTVLSYTSDIPNDTVSVAPDLDPGVVQTIVDALLAVVGTDEGSQALQDLYGATNLEPIDNSAYDPVREAIEVFDLEFETCAALTTVTPETGGAIRYTMQNGLSTTVEVPAAALTETVELEFSPLSALTEVPQGLADAGLAFRLTALVSGTGEPLAQLAAPVTLTVRYERASLGGIAESTLGLHYWDGAQWMREPTSAVDRAHGRVWALPTHLSLWAVLGEREVYLPLLLRG